MLTQQEIIREILAFPIAEQFEIVEKIQHNIKKNFRPQISDKKELTVEEKRAIVESLAGIAKVEGKTAPTDEEVKEDYANYLAEKYK
jgi:hypothetical protein